VADGVDAGANLAAIWAVGARGRYRSPLARRALLTLAATAAALLSAGICSLCAAGCNDTCKRASVFHSSS
jgi:hypothetical protein